MAMGIKLGSFLFWLVWKILAVPFILLFLVATFHASNASGLRRLLFLGIILSILVIANEESVYGYASENGIHFRRYFRMHFLPWNAISKIQWSNAKIVRFELKESFLFRRALATQCFDTRSEDGAIREVPELVSWLLLAKPEGADGIMLNGPGI